jgi:hypothetical protein
VCDRSPAYSTLQQAARQKFKIVPDKKRFSRPDARRPQLPRPAEQQPKKGLIVGPILSQI